MEPLGVVEDTTGEPAAVELLFGKTPAKKDVSKVEVRAASILLSEGKAATRRAPRRAGSRLEGTTSPATTARSLVA